MSSSVFGRLNGSKHSSPILKEFRFPDGVEDIRKLREGENWPIVYIIHNDEEAYVGETSSAVKRYDQHCLVNERGRLNRFCIIFDQTFNKSAILDIENTLIQLLSSDNSYKLQNKNAGQSTEHNYYQRLFYTKKVEIIWKELHSFMKLNTDYWELRNTDLFKYSPYIALNTEQTDVCNKVISDISTKLISGQTGRSIINGSAGTGKTIVAINIISRLLDAIRFKRNSDDWDKIDESSGEVFIEDINAEQDLRRMADQFDSLNIGFVVPMTSMRKTMKDVFKSTNGKLKGCRVIGPTEVFKKSYDILFVDESHRLVDGRRPGMQHKSFKAMSEKLGLVMSDCSQADWIVRACKYSVFFYDEKQTVRSTDVAKEHYGRIANGATNFYLRTQMRCMAGDDYVDYLNSIFSCIQKEKLRMSDDFKFLLFDDVQDMTDKIKKLDKEKGLCRNVSGFAWKWCTKKKKRDDILREHLYDIDIGEYRYVWNTVNKGWITSKDSIDEIGCVHTVQGFDLNYVGVIIGREIDYDPSSNKIIVNRKYFYDQYAKKGMSDEDMTIYSINAYKVLMTRGISGCYVYVCNDNMRKYLERFIDVYDSSTDHNFTII